MTQVLIFKNIYADELSTSAQNVPISYFFMFPFYPFTSIVIKHFAASQISAYY